MLWYPDLSFVGGFPSSVFFCYVLVRCEVRGGISCVSVGVTRQLLKRPWAAVYGKVLAGGASSEPGWYCAPVVSSEPATAVFCRASPRRTSPLSGHTTLRQEGAATAKSVSLVETAFWTCPAAFTPQSVFPCWYECEALPRKTAHALPVLMADNRHAATQLYKQSMPQGIREYRSMKEQR